MEEANKIMGIRIENDIEILLTQEACGGYVVSVIESGECTGSTACGEDLKAAVQEMHDVREQLKR